MRSKALWALVAAVAVVGSLVFVLGGDSAEDSKQFAAEERKLPDGEFHIVTGGEPRSCDPHALTSLIENHIAANVHEGLVTWTENGPKDGLQPNWADTWTISPDRTVYTFHIRDGAKWSNGDRLTAHDFEWSWNRTRTTKSFYYHYMLDMAFVDTAVAKDDQTFVVTLKQPNEIFEKILTFPTLSVVHRATIEKHGERWCHPEHFVGSGAFTIVGRELGARITMRKSGTYWDAANVELDGIVAHTSKDVALNVDMYRKGRIDWTGLQLNIGPEHLDAYIGDNGALQSTDVTRYNRMSLSYVSFNTTRAPLDDARVRQALSLAIDRALLEETVSRDEGVPTVNFIPENVGGYVPVQTSTAANCEKAKGLLADAGYGAGAKVFPKMGFLFRVGAGTEEKVAPAIAAMWKKCLGIEVAQEGMQMKLWYPKVIKSHDFDVTMDGWMGDIDNPLTFFKLLTSDNPMNHVGFKNDAYDQAVARGHRASTQQEMQAGFSTADQILIDEMPVTGLFAVPRTHGVRPEWRGIVPNMAMWHPLKYVRKANKQVASR